MDFNSKILATNQQASGLGNGSDVSSDWAPIGGGGVGGKVYLSTEGGTVSMTVDVEILDAQSRTIKLYSVVFDSADTATIDLAENPTSHVRVNVPTYASGALYATYQAY